MTPIPTQAQPHDAPDRIGDGPSPSQATPDVVEVDNGPPRSKGASASPERKCIATGEKAARELMIRFVLDPSGMVTPDVGARLPGRGAWTLATREAIQAAGAKKAFSRAFKQQVQVPDGLSDLIENLLHRKCLDLLGFAKRAGDLILGFDMVREAIRTARPACLIEALDGAQDGRQKVLSLARALDLASDEPAETSVVGCFTAEELGMALGRDRVIHAVVKEGHFSRGWHADISRLGGFRPLVPESWTSATD